MLYDDFLEYWAACCIFVPSNNYQTLKTTEEMKKQLIPIFCGLTSLLAVATSAKTTIPLTQTKGDKEEVGTEPTATYDDATNTVEMAMDAEEQFKLKVIACTGKTVYACPVTMAGGIPVNYILPQLPTGAYTLRVESDAVINL